MSGGAIDPADPEIRRRNRRLGLTVGAVVLGILVTALIIFTNGGLPADAKAHARLEQRASATTGDAPASDDATDGSETDHD